MKILYGINSDGLGHTTRSMIIIDYLLKKGHEIHITTGKDTTSFKFLNSKYKNVYPIVKLEFAYKDNELREFHTLKRLIFRKRLPTKNLKIYDDLIKKIDPDIIISDFEPFSLMVAKFNEIPNISIDHQCVLTRTNIEFNFTKIFGYLLTKLLVTLMSANADEYIGFCFFKSKIIKENTQVFFPLFRSDIYKTKPKDGHYILVYDRINANTAKLRKQLTKIKEETFIVYGAKKNKIFKNIIYKKSNPNLYKDLAKSKAFITKAGHSSISEAIYYKKPTYSMPIKNQFEQETNAYYLKKLGLGESHSKITTRKIKNFIKNTPKYKKNLKNYNFNEKDKFFKKLDQTINRALRKYKNKKSF